MLRLLVKREQQPQRPPLAEKIKPIFDYIKYCFEIMFKKVISKSLSKLRAKIDNRYGYPEWVAYEPNLIPPLSLMQTEGIQVIEEWFRWAEEWSFLLKVYGNIGLNSHVLEIGCGLGRTAFPLRYILLEGTYDGFEICRYKVDFLQDNFTKVHPNFKFIWANIQNTFYNPTGDVKADNFVFPYADNSFDIVYAASIFTHLLPNITENYFRETTRVLQKNGRVVFSFFILDNYRPGQPRPFGFNDPMFNFDHPYASFGSEFSIANPSNPEELTAYKKSLIQKYATEAGLEFVQEPITGLWSGITSNWVGTQDIVVLRKQ